MPTASGPGSLRSIRTSTTSTSVMLRWPSELLRPASTNGAMKDTVPAISRPRNAAVCPYSIASSAGLSSLVCGFFMKKSSGNMGKHTKNISMKSLA